MLNSQDYITAAILIPKFKPNFVLDEAVKAHKLMLINSVQDDAARNQSTES